jgi:hypothetical protein
MKTLVSSLVVIVFLVCFSDGIQAQTVASTLDQQKLMNQFIGTWHQNVAKDTVEVWEIQPYGEALISTESYIIKGNKTPLGMNNVAFSSTLGKYKGFVLYFNGTTSTWLGAFTSEKKFNLDFARNFDPANVSSKAEFVFEPPDNFTMTRFKDGVKTGEYKFYRVK